MNNPVPESLLRYNRAIAKANARIKQLQSCFEVSAKVGIYGVEITKKRKGVPAGRGYESMTFVEFVPFE